MTALDQLQQIGAGLETDFHALSSAQVDLVVAFAKQVRYRKPKNANGSTGRYYFARLQREGLRQYKGLLVAAHIKRHS